MCTGPQCTGGTGAERAVLTVLVEELVNSHLLWVKEQCGHVIVGFVGTEESFDGGVHILRVGNLELKVHL